MRVTLVCHSDLNGGAAVVTNRLMETLRSHGIDARTLVFVKYGNSAHVRSVSSRFMRTLTFTMERAQIFLNNGFNRPDLFKVSTAPVGIDISSHPWVHEADIVHLNWVNQGLLSLRGIRKISASGKPLVWTMHDMWPMTGICHHSYECMGFEQQCGACSFLHSAASPTDLSHRCLLRKQALYSMANIHFVAVSNWLANRARSSTLLRNKPIDVIPNPFPTDTFFTEPRKNIPVFKPMLDRDRIVFGAARLDDPIKGFDTTITALNKLFDDNPRLANRTGIVLFGDLRDRSMLDRLRFPYLYLGRITNERLLRQVYASAKVVLSTSHYETLPGTLIEGQAAGAIPVCFDRGGQSDIITHRHTGYLAHPGDIDDLIRGITWALETPVSRQLLHDNVVRLFDSRHVAQQYIALYESLLLR